MSKHIQSSHGLTQNTQTEKMLATEQFLKDNYLFRRNELNGKVEFVTLNLDAEGRPTKGDSEFRALTEEALNSIVLRAKREEICEKGDPRTDIALIVNSEDVPLYNPINDWLKDLPKWDGQNHVARLFSRLPGVSSEQQNFLSIWLRSTVAHWQQMDTLHGNEVVPTLIGAQGCGKTTFIRRLLPQHLREYYLDHLNLSNKFDKEMALTNNLLVNLDEFDAIPLSQQPYLKQTLSKNKVNGRPIFGRAQRDRLRYASFVATTNNRHPLTDATGSRRFLCLNIPDGQMIDNSGDIDYQQLYAQVLYELHGQHAPYWFNNDEVRRLQELNLNFTTQSDMTEMVAVCFRRPGDGEKVKSLSVTQILNIIREEYPSLKASVQAKVELGRTMKALGYEYRNHSNVAFYKAVPKKAA